MGKNEDYINVFYDYVPNMIKQGKMEQVRRVIAARFSRSIKDIISRYSRLPVLCIYPGRYTKLLVESRELYIEGRFYPCIAMCGITAERIAKQILCDSIMIKNQSTISSLNSEACSLLERIDMSYIYEILIKSSVVQESLRKPFKDLVEIRNKYTHARVDEDKDDIEKDSEKALKCLHDIVEGTISIFKDYDIKQGQLVSKSK